MLTVEKIGGTSMSRFGEVIDNLIIGHRKPDEIYGRIFVVSAYGGVTNELLEHKKTGKPGIYSLFAEGKDYQPALEKLLVDLKAINRGFAGAGLDVGAADAFIEDRIRRTADYLGSMAHLLSSGYAERVSILWSAREMLASIGEAHAAWNSVAMLRGRGVHALYVDLGGFDDAEYITIDERVKKAMAGIDCAKAMPILTGYTKGSEGIMREFDRGYSEITFSKVAVHVKADEAVIHKEFHLSSADPAIVGTDKSVIVGNTNYDVADQLADVGMEAIHPRASKPLEMAGIHLRLKNAFDPGHPGTLITREYICPDSRVEIITGSHKVKVVEIHDPSMVGAVGFDQDVMDIFRRHKVSYILKATNANSISHVVWAKDVSDAFLSELQGKYPVIAVREVAMVCAIGSNIAKPGVLAAAAQALAQSGTNILCVSQSLRQTNMQFVIERPDYEKAIRALNEALCA
ncbi:MAG: aspartate kinase [Spirochaetes bacterium]|nr:aspartate kinase [Spirochaetota bacterium]